MSPEQLQKLQQKTRVAPLRGRAPKTERATVAVVGLGYVGLPLAIRLATRGYPTVGFDIDEVKVAQLTQRDAPFLSELESESFKKAERISITADPKELKAASAYLICVPTPVHENTSHTPDLDPLRGAAEIVGTHMKEDDLVVVESTVNPGACEEIVLPILEKASGLSRNDFHFAHCPERINPGDARWNLETIPRVVGASTNEALERTVALYASIVDAQIVPMRTIKEAEAVKMVENTFRDINIAFVNELAMAFDRAGIDIVHVIEGAATKPFGFLPHYPGCGVGGHCIPVDPYYLIRYGRTNGFEHRFLKTARKINAAMPEFAVEVLSDALRAQKKRLKGATIALLGLSYKRDVGDLRESPALVIRDLLEKRGAKVRVFDPHVLHSSSVTTLADALGGADAALLATDHSEFRALAPSDFERKGVGIVVDGRNCLDKDAFTGSGVTYRGIGR